MLWLYQISLQLQGNIILVLLISPEEFIQNAQTFLITLSQKLRGSVRVRLIDGKPMIYSWSSSDGIGPLYNVSASRLHLLTASHPQVKRQCNIVISLFFLHKLFSFLFFSFWLSTTLSCRGWKLIATQEMMECWAQLADITQQESNYCWSPLLLVACLKRFWNGNFWI